MNGSEQAFLLYWYQYNCTDSRILTSVGYNAASIYDLAAISIELLGDAVSTDIMKYFLDEYTYEVLGEQIVMNASGDFGDAGNYYFDRITDYWVEGDKLAVQGPVMVWNSNMQSYVHQNMYTAYFSTNPAGSEIPYSFVSVTIGMDTPVGGDGPGSSI